MKLTAAFPIALALTFLPAAFGASPVLTLTPDRADGIYDNGEPAQVDVTANNVSGWSGTVTIRRKDTEASETIHWTDGAKPLRVSIPDKGPGWVVLEAVLQHPDTTQTPLTGKVGLLFRPREIVLTAPEPPDFREFWQEQLKAWKKLPDTVRLEPVDSPVDGVACWDLTIEITGQTPVRGYLALPSGAAEKSLPALLSLHGAGFRSASLGGAARQAKRGFLALDINAHGLANGQPETFYKKAETELTDYRRRGIESPETWYFKTMFLRVVRATDCLASRPEWNGRDLVLLGSSQGGAQALAGAALDERVTAVAASVPAFCNLLSPHPGWPNPLASAGERSSTTAGYFDAGNFARHIRVPVMLSLGLLDETCPPDGIQAMANTLRGESTLLYRPFMAHSLPNEIVETFDRFLSEKTRPEKFKTSAFFGPPDHTKTLEQINAEDRPYAGRCTWNDYQKLLRELSKEKYRVLPLGEFMEDHSTDKVLVGLRHDSDSHLLKALQMAEMEKAAGIRSTYFLLHSARYYGTVRDGFMIRNGAIDDLARQLHEMGFEIGIHRDLFNMMWNHHFEPRAFMKEEVAYYHSLGVPVIGTAAHGDRTTIGRKLNERWIFSEFGKTGAFVLNGTRYPYGEHATRDFGVEYEAYLLKYNTYLSDTAGKPVEEMIETLASLPPGARCVILIHPEHWGKPE